MIAITSDYPVKSRHGVQMAEGGINKADRPCKLVGYEGASHGFFNSSH